MNAKQLEHWILDNYQGVIVADAYRERSFFYNPDDSLPKGIYFATIKESDGPNDKASSLDRDGIYRLSIGVGKKQYQFLNPNLSISVYFETKKQMIWKKSLPIEQFSQTL